MPSELVTALLAHGGWATGLAIALWAWWSERKENRLMGQALLNAFKEQAVATTAHATETEKLGDKLDSFITTYTVRRPR